MPSNPPQSSVLLHRITTSSATSAAAMHHRFTYTPPSSTRLPDHLIPYHTHLVSPTQSSSAVTHLISAPPSSVWPLLRRFDTPHAYKHFLKSCEVLSGDSSHVGALRRVHLVSGLPAATSTERLDILNDDLHVLGFSVVGGDHRLSNYRSVTSLHSGDAPGTTVVVESYVVDTPPGNTKEETCVFVDTIVKCNLQSLAQIAENLAQKGD